MAILTHTTNALGLKALDELNLFHIILNESDDLVHPLFG